MDSNKELLEKIVSKMTIPLCNELLYEIEFHSEQYCIEEDMVKDMHLPLNKIDDTCQFNL